MDILYLPEDKKGYKYALTMVDLGNNKFDIEPMKNKDATTTKTAMETIFKRKILTKPKASIQTDAGKGFEGPLDKYLYNNNIYHKVTKPNRHTQNANVESLNKQ